MQNAVLLLLFLMIRLSPPDSAKIYEWRGHGRTGIYNESGLLDSWPPEGPKEVLTVEGIGNGFVSPVFTRDMFYVTGETDSISYLYCFNLRGEKVWKTALGKDWMESYPGSRCAPTIVDDLVYVGTGIGNLFCLSCKDGKIIWSKDLVKDFNGQLPMHGYSEAPLIDGDRIFWTPGGKEYNVVALNRFSGKLLWSNKCFGERSGYNSPKLIELPSRNILATFSAYHFMGLDTKTGRLLWFHEQDNYPPEKREPGNGDTHSNTVLYEDGSIYYAEGDGNCGVKLSLSPDGTGITEIWRNKGFDSYMGGIVKTGNYLYGCGTTRPGLLSINASSGILTDSLRIGTGALIAAENKLYYYTQKGEMILLDFNNGKMQRISSFRIKKGNLQHFAHPVINNGILYQRHGNVIIGYDIRKS